MATLPERNTVQKKAAYPKRRRWDYIATPEEERNLQNLKAIRKTLEKSQQEFEEGKGILMDGDFLENFLDRAKKRHLPA